MQIKFITGGANSAFGGFSAGDTLRCSPEMAKYLVEDLECAVYMDAPVMVAAHEPAVIAVEPAETPKRGHKFKARE